MALDHRVATSQAILEWNEFVMDRIMRHQRGIDICLALLRRWLY